MQHDWAVTFYVLGIYLCTEKHVLPVAIHILIFANTVFVYKSRFIENQC